jgi:hypothetical protein
MDVVEAVYGIDLERYAVGWPFRLVPELPARPLARGEAGQWHGQRAVFHRRIPR